MLVDRPVVECDYIRYTLPSLNLLNGENNQIFIDIPREDGVISLKDSYLEFYFSVVHKAVAKDRYVADDHMRLVNLGSIAISIKYWLTISSGKEMEEIDKAHVICLFYNLLSSSRESVDLWIGFHRSIEALEKELINNKTTEGKYQVRIYLKDVFVFAKDQYNCTFGLGYKLTFQRNSDNYILGHLEAVDDAVNLALAGRDFISGYTSINSKYIKSKIIVGTYLIQNCNRIIIY